MSLVKLANLPSLRLSPKVETKPTSRSLWVSVSIRWNSSRREPMGTLGCPGAGREAGQGMWAPCSTLGQRDQQERVRAGPFAGRPLDDIAGLLFESWFHLGLKPHFSTLQLFRTGPLTSSQPGMIFTGVCSPVSFRRSPWPATYLSHTFASSI